MSYYKANVTGQISKKYSGVKQIKKMSQFSIDSPNGQTDYYYNKDGKEVLLVCLNKNDTMWGSKTYYDELGREYLKEHFEHNKMKYKEMTVYDPNQKINYIVTFNNYDIILSDHSIQKTDTTFYKYDGINYSTLRNIYSLAHGPPEPIQIDIARREYQFNVDSTLKSFIEKYPATYPSVYKTTFEYKRGKKLTNVFSFHNDTLLSISKYSYKKNTKKCINKDAKTGKTDITIDTFDESNNRILWENYDINNKLLHKTYWIFEYYKD